MVASVGRLWSRQILGMRWRRWLVLRLQGAMLTGSRHHRLEMGEGADNPDQRIGENTRWATAIAVDLALGLIYALVLLVSFAGMLWHLSAGLRDPARRGREPGRAGRAALGRAALCRDLRRHHLAARAGTCRASTWTATRRRATTASRSSACARTARPSP
jgi:hypothetical protein